MSGLDPETSRLKGENLTQMPRSRFEVYEIYKYIKCNARISVRFVFDAFFSSRKYIIEYFEAKQSMLPIFHPHKVCISAVDSFTATTTVASHWFPNVGQGLYQPKSWYRVRGGPTLCRL